jgi:hypothetical protein
MKNTIQRVIMAFLLITITVMSLRMCFQKEKENANLKTVVEIKQDSTKHWKDLYNTEHAEKQLADANYSSLRVVYGELLDSVSNRLNSKPNDVQAVTTAGTIATGSIRPTIDTVLLSDSTAGYRFNYKDKWLSLDGIISKEPVINYMFSDSVVFTSYRRKTGFLRKDTYIDGYSLNPNVRITGITGIRVSNPRKDRFSVGPYIGYGWNGSTWSPSIGISLQYSVIKF